MRRTLLVISFLLVFQAGFSQKVKLGMQASPQLSWIKSSDSHIVNAASRLGIKYGLEADIFLFGVNRYSLNTGLFVSNNSFKAQYATELPLVFDKTTLDNPVLITYKLNYLEIPLNLKLRSDQFYRMTYYGQFGLSTMVNIGATATSTDSKLNGTNVSEAIGLFNLGLLVGAGAEYDIGGNTALHFGIQYTNGFVDISTIKGLDETTNLNSLRLTLGIMF
jgi:opacity protein-like surface antigen